MEGRDGTGRLLNPRSFPRCPPGMGLFWEVVLAPTGISFVGRGRNLAPCPPIPISHLSLCFLVWECSSCAIPVSSFQQLLVANPVGFSGNGAAFGCGLPHLSTQNSNCFHPIRPVGISLSNPAFPRAARFLFQKIFQIFLGIGAIPALRPGAGGNLPKKRGLCGTYPGRGHWEA